MNINLPQTKWPTLLIVMIIAGVASVFPPQLTHAQKAQKSLDNEQYRKAQIEIERAMQEVERAIAELRRVDLPAMQAELKQSLQTLLAQKEELSKHLAQELSAVDTELKQMKGHVNAAALEQELRSAMQDAQREMGKAQEQLQQHKQHLQNDIAEELRKASVELQESKKNLALVKQGLELMKAEGLIPNSGEKLQIEYRDDNLLYINGKAQSQAVSDKYRKYFGKGNFVMGSSINRRPV